MTPSGSDPTSRVLFDPAGSPALGLRPRWDPIEGCEAATVALRRSTALAAPVGSRGVSGRGTAFRDRATTVLTAYLTAAATADADMAQVQTWAGRGWRPGGTS